MQGCFLELAEPNIDNAMQRLAERGVKQAVVMPLMLFEAGHAKRDIPLAAKQAAQRYGLHIRFATALTNHPRLLELSAQRFREAISTDDIDPQEVLWIFVGRGSRDPEASAKFHEFLENRRQLTPVGESQGAFLAMASPRFETIAADAGKRPLKWVVVQPHLLFAGELLERLQRMVNTQDNLVSGNSG